MDHLPAETLQQIARHLYDSHIPSLACFSLVSRTCYGAAKVWLFRSIRLQVTITDPAQLQREALRVAEILKRTQSQDHVRQLAIVLRRSGRDEQELISDNDIWLDRSYGEDHRTQADLAFPGDAPFKPIGAEEDRAWLPVAGLIGLLSRLNDLVYMPDHTLPPCLPRVLHEEHPQCRLHIYRSRFKSLHEPTIDPHELAIATSPCLHSITLRHVFRVTHDKTDWNLDAHLRLVAGMAPNLRKVRNLACVNNINDPSLGRPSEMPLKPWPGLSSPEDVPSLGHLESLTLHGNPTRTRRVLPRLAEATDFSCLRVLDLSRISSVSLTWAADNVSLPSLKKLRLHIVRCEDSDTSCVAFFTKIPPLEALQYSGPHDKTLDCILERHGPSLRQLSLDLGIDLDFSAVRKLQVRCPLLESLKMDIKRYLSDETEVSVYRTLGKMCRLTELSLTLGCSDPQGGPRSQSPLEDFDDPFDRAIWQESPVVKFGHVRIAFLSSALDEALARSIWDTINEAGEGKPLQSLKLQTSGSRSISRYRLPDDMSEIFECLSRSFRIDRSIRDDDKDGVTIRELGKRAREAKCEARRYILERPGYEDTRSPAVAIFRHIWPKKEGSTSWHDDWSSLPLRK